MTEGPAGPSASLQKPPENANGPEPPPVHERLRDPPVPVIEPTECAAPPGPVQVRPHFTFHQPGLAAGAGHLDDCDFRYAHDLQLSQSAASGDLTIQQIRGEAFAQYGLLYSTDPQNGTMTGSGPIGGLFIDPVLLNTLLGLSFAGVPPFGGFLDANGETLSTIPGVFVAPLSGVSIWAVGAQVTSTGALDFTLVKGITFL